MARPHALYRTQSAFREEMLDLLTRRVHAVLGTENPNGSVQMAPVAFFFDGGRFLFESAATTRKVRNLLERPRARVLVEAPGGAGWVSAAGPTEIVRGRKAQEPNARVIARYLSEEGRAGVGRHRRPTRRRHDRLDARVVVLLGRLGDAAHDRGGWSSSRTRGGVVSSPRALGNAPT